MGGGGGGVEYFGFQVTVMCEWGQKSKLQILPRASNKTPKTPGRKINSPKKIHTKLPSLKNFQKPLKDKTRKGLHRTTRPGYAGTTTNLQTVLDYPKNPFLSQATQKMFLPLKNRNRKFQTQKNPLIFLTSWNPEYPPWEYSKYKRRQGRINFKKIETYFKPVSF